MERGYAATSLRKITAKAKVNLAAVNYHFGSKDTLIREVFERRVKQLQPYGRPMICTEYLARGAGSTFDTSLPLGRRYNVGMINWGFVDGKT